ncbi:hypothetical protein B7C51_06875 [Paenibacillus larvae subsp. pulvifaciens]|uniref:Uncharacterized protein n=1 Tax=Paenibacillus larvae subsp. pulvifaciens TaxID=1477 RepID=A0A1V0UR49_9BACL|nr:hypothetical protein [Paenibacillus larvae]ARF67611.1 hypothetical protein B7C51_06875 [Paenibacillus larvae subsp. pulvifaciens]
MRNYIRNHYRNCPRHTRKDREFMKVMTESERRMREFDDEYEEVSDRIAEGREGMKRGKRLYDR